MSSKSRERESQNKSYIARAINELVYTETQRCGDLGKVMQ